MKMMAIFILGVVVGAIAHECDLAQNFKRSGDANSFFWPIVDSKNKGVE